MIAELGLAALILAAALALLQLALAGLALASARGGAETGEAPALFAAIRPVAVVQGALAILSFAALTWLFAVSDMSVQLVVQNSHSAKPMLYKLTGTWGNHEGSMLLWVMVLALSGAAIAAFERGLKPATLIATLGGQAAIAIGFYAFLLFASNPFQRMPIPAAEGLGLNPILQDPGLAFHPPTLYIGYVGLSVAFSFAIGALVTRDVGPAFARAMRPWVLAAWLFLTIGIAAGSYWAYYELGWGGWWFWDPVENASLMPWLAATALLHSVTVLATRDGLRAWTIVLALVAFAMSMLGTFLVRSGILTSVHAFAVDPSRGAFILALLAIYIGGALALFALRIGAVRQGRLFDPVSREGALVANNLLLSVILGIVLIGTLYPIFAEAIGQALSVGPPFFNKTTVPVTMLLFVVMAVGPMLRWRRDDGAAVLQRMTWPIAAAAGGGAIAFLIAPGAGVFPITGFAMAAGLAVASIAPLAGRALLRTPLATWGMVVAHLGVAVSIAGMSADAAFTREVLVAARPGQNFDVGPYNLRFEGVRPTVSGNWSAVEARLVARRGDDGTPFLLRPQQRYFASPPTETSEAALATVWDGQLYAVIGQRSDAGRWQLRLWWKPWVTLIWWGAVLLSIGGLLALIGRVRRERRARKAAAAEAAEAAWA